MKKWETPKVDELTIANTEEVRASFWRCARCCKLIGQNGTVGPGQSKPEDWVSGLPSNPSKCPYCGSEEIRNDSNNFTCKMS